MYVSFFHDFFAKMPFLRRAVYLRTAECVRSFAVFPLQLPAQCLLSVLDKCIPLVKISEHCLHNFHNLPSPK